MPAISIRSMRYDGVFACSSIYLDLGRLPVWVLPHPSYVGDVVAQDGQVVAVEEGVAGDGFGGHNFSFLDGNARRGENQGKLPWRLLLLLVQVRFLVFLYNRTKDGAQILNVSDRELALFA